MKHWKLLPLLMSLLATCAFGQAAVQDGQGYRQQLTGQAVIGINRSDSTARLLTTDSNGNLKVVEASSDRDGNVLFQDIINNSSLAYNAGDSSAVLNTHDLAHAVLWIKAVPAAGGNADTTNTIRLVFQVRAHLNALSDSSSTFAFYPLGSTGVGVTAGLPDSLTQGHLTKGGRNLWWSGEFVVQVQAIRKAHGGSIAVNGHDWYYPSGIAIPLDNLFGRNWWSPYTSVRVRNITGTACSVQAHLVGTPL